MAKLVSPESMIALLQSFTVVLDEFGVSHGRAKRAAICAAEGLMIVGVVFYQDKLESHECIGRARFNTSFGYKCLGNHQRYPGL
jgi:hypothetical protein